jgi:hypothetical protein
MRPHSFLPNSSLTMRALFSLLAVTILCFPFSRAAGDSSPKPRQIIERGIAAMGGQERLKSITTRQVFGSIQRMRDGAVGRYEIATVFPSSYYSRIEFGAEFEQTAFNRISAYEWSSANGLRNLKDDDLTLARLYADFQNGFWYHDEAQRLSGATKFLLRAAFGVGFFLPTDEAKRNQTPLTMAAATDSVMFEFEQKLKTALYFDKTSGRLIAEELTEEVARTGQTALHKEVFIYDDFRAIDGILKPHFIRLLRDGTTYEIKVERIVYNETIAPAKFDMPPPTQPHLLPLHEIVEKAKAKQELFLRAYDTFQYDDKYRYCATVERSSSEPDYLPTEACRDRTTVTEVSYYRGFPLRRIIEDSWRNEVYLPSEQRRVKKERAKIDKLIAEKTKSGELPQAFGSALQHPGLLEYTDGSWGVNIYLTLQHAAFRNLRREQVAERSFYVLDYFPPTLSSKPRTERERYLTEHGGRLWIDAQDFAVSRLETFAIRLPIPKKTYGFSDFYGIPPGKFIHESVLEQSPLCEGLWLPASAKGYGETTFSNYRQNGLPLKCSKEKPTN